MADRIDRLFETAMCDHWWLPDHAQVVRRPEIEYVHSPHKSKLFNAVVRVDPGLDDYRPLVDEVMAAHEGRASEWRLGAPSHSETLIQTLKEAGYENIGTPDAWSIDVNTARKPAPDHVRVERIEDPQGLRDMMSVMAASFSRFEVKIDDEIAEMLDGCVGPTARCRRYVAYDAGSGAPLSTGAVNLFPDLGIAFMWGGSTVPDARGRGVYSAVVTARMNEARRMGLERIGLYAMRETSGPIVKAQGFQKHGACEFWALKPDS